MLNASRDFSPPEISSFLNYFKLLNINSSRSSKYKKNVKCNFGTSDDRAQCDVVYSFAHFNRRAFPITESELKAIAAAAMIGLNIMPDTG